MQGSKVARVYSRFSVLAHDPCLYPSCANRARGDHVAGTVRGEPLAHQVSCGLDAHLVFEDSSMVDLRLASVDAHCDPARLFAYGWRVSARWDAYA